MKYNLISEKEIYVPDDFYPEDDYCLFCNVATQVRFAEMTHYLSDVI